jgi:hypothetical protein
MWTVTALRCGRGSAGGMRDCVAAAPFIAPTLSLDLFIVMFGIIWSHLWKEDTKIYIPFVRNDRMGLTCIRFRDIQQLVATSSWRCLTPTFWK